MHGVPRGSAGISRGRAPWLVRRDSGQDLLEYGLLTALIAIVAMAGVGTLGTTINTVFWEFIAVNF